jgi:hypothetical protein
MSYSEVKRYIHKYKNQARMISWDIASIDFFCSSISVLQSYVFKIFYSSTQRESSNIFYLLLLVYHFTFG